MTAKQLTDSILQLAIQGKLVPQNPDDEPASVLLDRIREEKKRLVKEGKLKKKDLEEISVSEEEIPFEIPESWEWVKIKSVLLLLTDGTHNSPPSFNTGDYLYITAKNIKPEGVDLSNVTYVTKEVHDEIYSRCNPEYGDVLYIKDGATAGVVTLNDLKEPFSMLSSVALLKQSREMNSRYLLAYFRSPYCYNTVRSSMKGAAITRITLRMIQEWLIPVPPIQEQVRIAEIVDSVSPYIAEYGSVNVELEQMNVELPEKLKKSILQEAIMGKLGTQDPNDEPASVLLDRIREEKKQLVKAGVLKKKDLVERPVEEDEIPYSLPYGWEIVRLGDVTFNNGQKIPDSDFSYIDIGSIDNKRQKLSETDNIISANNAPSRARRIVNKGDVLYATVRPYLHNICIVDRDFSKEPIASTGFAVLSCVKGLYNKFLFYYLLSPVFDEYANDGDNAKGMAYPAINDKKLYNGVVPLPPLAEQHRIVEKIEALFAEVDHIEI